MRIRSFGSGVKHVVKTWIHAYAALTLGAGTPAFADGREGGKTHAKERAEAQGRSQGRASATVVAPVRVHRENGEIKVEADVRTQKHTDRDGNVLIVFE